MRVFAGTPARLASLFAADPKEPPGRHKSGGTSSKCPRAVLPDIPDIMQERRQFSSGSSNDNHCPHSAGIFSQSLEVNSGTALGKGNPKSGDAAAADAATAETEERPADLKRSILNSSAKLPNSYGTQPRGGAPQRKTRRRYSLNRIHRTSSLTQRAESELIESRPGKRAPSGPHVHGNGGPDDGDSRDEPHVAVSDIIGSFGLFQMLVLLFSGLREGLVGYDALIMSVILQPESRFLCADNLPERKYEQFLQNKSAVNFEQLLRLENALNKSNLSTSLNNWNETAQCFRSPQEGPLVGGQGPIQCEHWIFANETAAQLGPSLVAEWSLVCQYHWLVAFVESAFFFGLVTGNLVWGYYADKVGRRPAYLAAHTISLIFGSLAVFMPSIYLFTLCRFLSAFGSIGYNIIYSIQVELIGAKHRSFSTTLNHLGWGLGVICIPLVDHLFDDYRPIIALAPLLSLVMYPWAFWLPESPRWLMANGHYKQARRELIRAAKFNGKEVTPKLEKDIFALEQRLRADKLAQKAQSGAAFDEGSGAEKRSYRLIFTTPALVRDTLILSYVAFVGHLYYYVQTINFAYMKHLSTEANFITSGAGEWVSVLVGAILLKFFTRKTCMSLFLIIMASSFAFQSLIDSELLPQLDTALVITTNNGLGTLSSLLLVFVALIVNQEVYPTVVRQTGTSITNTVGESGSTLAPMLIQFSRIIGPWRANALYAAFCSFGIVAVQFVTRTDDIELPDN